MHSTCAWNAPKQGCAGHFRCAQTHALATIDPNQPDVYPDNLLRKSIAILNAARAGASCRPNAKARTVSEKSTALVAGMALAEVCARGATKPFRYPRTKTIDRRPDNSVPNGNG